MADEGKLYRLWPRLVSAWPDSCALSSPNGLKYRVPLVCIYNRCWELLGNINFFCFPAGQDVSLRWASKELSKIPSFGRILMEVACGDDEVAPSSSGNLVVIESPTLPCKGWCAFFLYRYTDNWKMLFIAEDSSQSPSGMCYICS